MMDIMKARLRIKNILDEKMWAYRYAKEFCKTISKESSHYLSIQSVDRMIVEEEISGYMFLGESEKGQREGYGFEYTIDGVLYMGEWHENKYHGRGYLFCGKRCYYGKFINGYYQDNNVQTGTGRQILVDSQFYQE